jgi:hypothetical protein
VDLLIEKLETFSDVNVNGNWMFGIIGANENQLENLLVESWMRRKMLNILLVVIGSNGQIEVMSYDPFKLVGNERGVVWRKTASESTIDEISNYTTKMLDKKTKNLDGFPLNFTMYESDTTATPVYDDNKNLIRYSDADGEMAEMFGKFLSARINYMTQSDGYQLGFKSPNGSFNGALAQIENGSADMACNIRLLTYVGTDNTAYLEPADVIHLRYMVPKQKAPIVKLKISVLQMFNFQVRCLFVVVIAAACFFWMFLNAFLMAYHQDFNSNRHLNLTEVVFFTVSILSGVTIPDRKFCKSLNRIILAFMLMFAMIVCNTFQGAIISYLSTPGKSHDINTLADLVNSDLKIVALVVIKGDNWI